MSVSFTSLLASRRFAPKRLLVGSLLAGGVLVWPMAVAPSFGALLVLAVLLGLASGGALTLCYTLGGLLVPPDRRTTAFGFFSAAALFGGAVSPSVAGFLAEWDLKGIYHVDGALVLLLGLALTPWTAAVAAAPSPAAPPVPEASSPAQAG